jgi:hypothetical protein
MCAPLLVLGIAACGSASVSTAGFKGEQHEVAQTVANLQSDATAANEKKICANDLSASIVSRLGGTKGCEEAIKNQLAEIDSLEVKVKSVKLGAGGVTATVLVESKSSGKNGSRNVSLVKEGGKWKVSGL